MIKLGFKIISTVFSLLIIGYISYIYVLPKLDSVRGDSDSEYFTVERIVDGDTFKLTTGERVRLLGIDTPEKFDSKKLDYDSKNSGKDKKTIQNLGKLSTEYVKSFLEGKKVKMIKEPNYQDKDQYGRLLRYVYLQDGTFVNAKILKDGYGQVFESFPFSKIDEFRKIQKEARENKKGLWAEINGLKQF
ncbi:hypothetical protein BH10BAC5_BH10BAC5_07350 [soil metagenome]